MNDSIEILVADRRQNPQTDPLILELARGNVVSATIDGDFMSASHKPGGQVLGKSFKAAVAGRYTAGSKDSDTHRD